MRAKKLTPVLVVESIEPCLEFWTTLGFEKTAEVPHGDQIGFVILQKDGVEIMYESVAALAEDIPALAHAPLRGAYVFIEVDDVDWVDSTLETAERVMPRRKTFYGSDEVIVREPGGNVVTFAKMPE